MQIVKEFETCQCYVIVSELDYQYNLCKIYCVSSCHKKTGKVLYRFGTKAQVNSIVKSYNIDRRFKL